MTPFDVGKDISNKKQGLINNENEKEYASFLVNKYFSYFPDTVFFANEMNRRPHLDNKLQHDYLLHGVRKASRYTKWSKKEKLDTIQAIQAYYGYSVSRAKEAMKILTDEQIEYIVQKVNPQP